MTPKQSRASFSSRSGIKTLQPAAIIGDADAQNRLGIRYAKGKGVKNDWKRATELFARAAEQNHGLAQFNLGICYKLGVGVAQDAAKAAELFAASAKQGYAAAQYELAMSYLQGKGVRRNSIRAAKFFTLATNQGHSGAQLGLSACLGDGRGIEQDCAKAYALSAYVACAGKASPSQIKTAENIMGVLTKHAELTMGLDDHDSIVTYLRFPDRTMISCEQETFPLQTLKAA